MSYQLKEWRTLRTSPLHKIELMLDRAEDMRHTNRLEDAMVYLTRIWNAIDGGFFPLSGNDEDTCKREELKDKLGEKYYANYDLVDDLWQAMACRCPWAFRDNSYINSMNFTYRDN